MNAPNVVNGDDEQFVLLLARYSEAINGGGDADPAADPALPSELQLRLQRAVGCLRRLRHLRAEPPLVESITQILARNSTLQDGIVGGQIGRFRLLRSLGLGGGGIVFLAFDPDLRREVALKVPHLPALLAPDMRRRFLREARAAACLDHPNLVPVHEVGEANGVCYIVSAFCRGGSLAQWLAARTRPVPIGEAAELVALLADAVQYVHQRHIYHRDIKPGNILLDSQRAGSISDGYFTVTYASGSLEQFTPRLTDFGLAKQMDSDSGQTMHGAAVGTPSYMAPEQFECRPGSIGRCTDVYGLGAVLYELLIGRPPFKGETDSATLDQVLFQSPVPPRLLRSEVPRNLETICLKCLEKLPEYRYASAAELADDLRRFLASEPIQARPQRSAYRLSKWMRRQPWQTASISFSCLIVLALLLGGSWLHRMKQTYEQDLVVAAKLHEERGEANRHTEQRLRQYHYADDIYLADRQWTKRRFDEMADQLQKHRHSLDAIGSEDPRGFEWYYLANQAGILRRRMRSPDHSLYCLTFSPDGKICATGHQDGAIRLWDRASGQMLLTLSGHKLPVYTLAYSPDGKHLVSGGGQITDRSHQGELRLWDTATLKSRPVLTEQFASVNSVAFSLDGHTLAAGLGDSTVKLWDLPAVTLRKTVSFGTGVASVAFLSSTNIAVGLVDGTVAVRDSRDGHALASWRAHPKVVWSLANLRSNGLLVSSGHDCAVRLWRRAADRRDEYRHDGEVWGVAVSPDDQTVASVGREGIVKLYDVKEQCVRFWFAIPPIHGRCVAFSPDGKDLAVGSEDGNLWLFDASRTTKATSWLGHQHGPLPREAWAVAFSPDGKVLASAGDDHQIRLWDPGNGRLLKTLTGHQCLVSCLAFSPDGKLLASGSFDKQANVKVWKTKTGTEAATLSGHSQPVYALAFAPDGKSLATAGRDGTTRLWDLSTGKDCPILSGHNIQSLAFSSDGRTLAVAGDSHILFLWDIQEGKIRQTLPRHPHGHVAVAFSPDGQLLATGDADGDVRFFDTVTGRLRRSCHSSGHIVNCLAFSPDGKTLASAGFDKKVKLWQVTTSRDLLTLPEQKDRVRWLAFSPDGAMLAIAGHDGVLTIYRADKTEP